MSTLISGFDVFPTFEHYFVALLQKPLDTLHKSDTKILIAAHLLSSFFSTLITYLPSKNFSD